MLDILLLSVGPVVQTPLLDLEKGVQIRREGK